MKDVRFHPTQNFGHFWAAFSLMSLIFFQIFGPASSPHTVVHCLLSSSCLLLWPCFVFFVSRRTLVRCTLCSVWHGCLYQWSLDSLRLHRAINTEQSQCSSERPADKGGCLGCLGCLGVFGVFRVFRVFRVCRVFRVFGCLGCLGFRVQGLRFKV